MNNVWIFAVLGYIFFRIPGAIIGFLLGLASRMFSSKNENGGFSSFSNLTGGQCPLQLLAPQAGIDGQRGGGGSDPVHTLDAEVGRLRHESGRQLLTNDKSRAFDVDLEIVPDRPGRARGAEP